MTAVYPTFQNTYIRDHEASNKLVVDFARDLKRFRVNNYCQIVPVKKMAGYYLEMTIEEAGRILASGLENFVWYDGDPAPEQDEGTEKHEWKPFECVRRVFHCKMGHLTIDQASWDIMAQHASIKARQAMTARTQLAVTALTTTGNYAASHVLDVTAISGNTGNWKQSTTARQDIKRSLLTGLEVIKDDTLDAVDEDAFRLVISSSLAKDLALTQEIVDYIKGSPDALAQIKGELPGRNVMYGLPDRLYGIPLEVESTRKVTNRKGATRATSSVFPTTQAALCSRPGGLVGVDGAPTFATVVIFAQEEMTVEKKDDTDNRRVKARVVDTVDVKVAAPASGILFTNCSS